MVVLTVVTEISIDLSIIPAVLIPGLDLEIILGAVVIWLARCPVRELKRFPGDPDESAFFLDIVCSEPVAPLRTFLEIFLDEDTLLFRGDGEKMSSVALAQRLDIIPAIAGVVDLIVSSVKCSGICRDIELVQRCYCACTAVIATVFTMSSTEQPRERSLQGFASPWRTAKHSAPPIRCVILYPILPA